jgi:hypothetical protein
VRNASSAVSGEWERDSMEHTRQPQTHHIPHTHTHTHTHPSHTGTGEEIGTGNEPETTSVRNVERETVTVILWNTRTHTHTHTHTHAHSHTHTHTHPHTPTHPSYTQAYQLPSAEHSSESRCLTGRVASICCLLPVYLMGNQFI